MSHQPKICATIEARMTSSRLPGKVLLEAVGKPLLELMIERLKKVPSLDCIVLATTTNADDDALEALAHRLDINCHRGSENDVLQRVVDAAHSVGADTVFEALGDCPCIDPVLIEECLIDWKLGGADYICNCRPYAYPVGMEVEVVGTAVLEDIIQRTDDPYHHEHVTTFILKNPNLYRLRNVAAPPELTSPNIHITLDTQADYLFIRSIFEKLYPNNPDFNLAEILDLLKREPELLELVADVKRNFF